MKLALAPIERNGKLKKLSLRRADTCSVCSSDLEVGDTAWWDASTRTVHCIECNVEDVLGGTDDVLYDRSSAASTLEIDRGEAGKSALDEYQRRHDLREARIDAKYGRFAGVVKFLTDDPQSTLAWKKGSIGEQKLALALSKNLGDAAILLNDRKVPKSRANIDHIAIAPSGVWVIDAKNYTGLVEQRDVGGFFSTDIRLYVGGRDRTKLAEGLEWQTRAVRAALADEAIVVRGALCFTDAEWGWFAKPFEVKDVFVSGPNTLAKKMEEVQRMSSDRVLEVAQSLARALPAKV